jgi:hypothetical protein
MIKYQKVRNGLLIKGVEKVMPKEEKTHFFKIASCSTRDDAPKTNKLYFLSR